METISHLEINPTLFVNLISAIAIFGLFIYLLFLVLFSLPEDLVNNNEGQNMFALKCDAQELTTQ